MRIAKITSDKVFKVADQLQNKGIKPTVAKVHEKLGAGSTTTVHKYLTDWKAQNVGGTKLVPAKLQSQLVEKLKIIENLTLEIFNSSTLVAHEKAQNAKLEGRVLELTAKLAERDAAHSKTVAYLTSSNESVKESFDKSMTILSDQLHAINAQAIAKVQEAGQHFDDKVMDLKLELREVKDQLALKDKELKKLNDQLIEQALNSRAMAKDEYVS